MSFTGNEEHDISLQEASDMTARYRDNQSEAYFIKAEYFGREAIESILSQENCVGIRIYYGLDENNVQRIILVGVTADENDICNGILAERGTTCPPRCSDTNMLNS